MHMWTSTICSEISSGCEIIKLNVHTRRLIAFGSWMFKVCSDTTELEGRRDENHFSGNIFLFPFRVRNSRQMRVRCMAKVCVSFSLHRRSWHRIVGFQIFPTIFSSENQHLFMVKIWMRLVVSSTKLAPHVLSQKCLFTLAWLLML